ncbi:OmpA family protein [Rhodophyticola sp. MJ-SS7]|nr:OmpA family protein [Rhodophyticola sp. MJ-SS7]MDU8944690.1 OmpA family protein [Rhodophyticola sp. MJ-SS7]
MRFLFFETFRHPSATVALQLSDDMVSDIATVRRKFLTLPYRISLHGISLDRSAEVTVTYLGDNLVSVSSAAPISLSTTDFGLDEGRQKLEEAAGVTIVPAALITFDFLFAREGAPLQPATQTTGTATPASVALETQGNFSQEECIGRFEILSRTGNIYFSTGSARLTEESAAVLDAIGAIIARCPDMVIEIGGHTDSDGSDAANQRLSEARARAVAAWFADAGIPANRLLAVGYGEARPAFPNTSSDNKRRNRRIEFALAQ